ncbi:IRE protein kinase [Coccidioides immitis RS]|uniref:non-specific serine/threonine protein kinase n=1 Tax=Coccidioides immitis (strain RS) TaxID=246410 RepID=J3K0E4_COCIM|nr:IRE protein kinase [Coccidioides immitis RS]EAS27311.3 IRE protein kinase [Coccidioides immitis RS]TPX20151.1 bifunctional endoribonuclease/protein kinase ire1 [Coccidioides immitis]
MVWRLRRARTSLPAGIAIFLPLLAAQQQLSLAVSAPSPSPPSSSSSLRQDARLHPHVDILPDTPASPSDLVGSSSTDASALATLALAASNPAVRAPPVQISSRNNLALQLQARSLQDWEVEDFVLLATVDGTIHARDRKTGGPRWALEVPSSPMVETIYHAAAAAASSSSPNGTSGLRRDDDFLWIVEPTRDGNLFVYNPGPNGRGLHRLGLTVKMLVDETPYSGSDPPVTYTARKETTLYTVDARTGAILRVFSSRGSTPPDQTCRRLNEFGSIDEGECESTGTLTLGRIEYTVTVQDTDSGLPICTIKYAEWAPNTRDADLQSQYFRTMDERHIYSMHDGVIFGFDHSKVDGRRYTQKFSSPVARVFDVARPLTMETPDTPLVLLAQPPPDDDYSATGIEGREARVFVNCTETGGWYAMSELSYPLVTGRAKRAEGYNARFHPKDKGLTSLSLSQQRAALVGVHSLARASNHFDRTVPSISGPPADRSNDTPRELVEEQPEKLPAPATPRINSVIIQKGWDNAVDIFVTIILLLIGAFVYLNSRNIQELAKQKLDLKNIISLDTPAPPATPTSILKRSPRQQPIDDLRPEPSELPAIEIEAEDSVSETVPVERSVTPRPATPFNEDPGAAETVDDNPSLLQPQGTPRVRIVENSNEDDVDEVDGPAARSPEKKSKARRGRRGGQAHKRRKKPAPANEEDQNPGDEATPRRNQVPSQSSLRAELSRTRTQSTEMLEADGSIRIGQLKVYTDTVLGHGSHGTVVYKGSFDGRHVAVKRMLVEFYDVAAHEVGLLQESDDHNNVIRYFCREQTAGFLYIALELCPASLQEIVERPWDYPTLITGDLALPDILRQITAGVRYLHSLKIVHRDLKPQNILVAAPKARRGSSVLRLLISDFGLCKKLEDNQSSFRATTAHAAGTSGWRAPELLVDDESPANPAMWSNNSMDSSEPAVVDPQTNRRATRAIDIFSLGCVFYYVLTRGGHPFDKDGKFMREANIVKGYHNLDELKRLGDYAFEAEDLIRKMLSLDPRSRPDATTVMIHPFFWSPAERLSFLCDVSDHFEFEPRDPPSPALKCLESVGGNVMYPDMDFLKSLPKDFKDSLGKQRKYTGSRMLDLLRALRNKRNHYNDMPENLKAHIGGLPDGYLQFWTVRFPSLLINCHWVITKLNLMDTERFKRYFTPPE